MTHGTGCVAMGGQAYSGSNLSDRLQIKSGAEGILGQGSYGEVRLGTYRVKENQVVDVAIKKYRFYSDCFRAEVHALKSLKHRNIIEYFASGYTPDTGQYVVMSYCNGGTLEQKLQQVENYFGVSQLSFVKAFHDITDAVLYMHSENFYHRDIKPGNILIQNGKDGEIYLLSDFDSVKKVKLPDDTSEVLTSIRGTEAFMHQDFLKKLDESKASEQPQEELPLYANLSPREADFYSLGVTLYQCATGKLPFYSEKKNIYQAARFGADAPEGALAGYELLSGAIIYECQLPATSPLSGPYRNNLEVILRGLWHQDKKKVWGTDKFKVEAERFNSAKPITFLDQGSAQYLTILLSEKNPCQDLPGVDVRVPVYAPLKTGQTDNNNEEIQPLSLASLIKWSGFSPDSTKLYFQGERLKECPGFNTLQNTSRDNPIIIAAHNKQLTPDNLKLRTIHARPIIGSGDVQLFPERVQLLREKIDQHCAVIRLLVEKEQDFSRPIGVLYRHCAMELSNINENDRVIRRRLKRLEPSRDNAISKSVSQLNGVLDTVDESLTLNQALPLTGGRAINDIYRDVKEIKRYLEQKIFPKRFACKNMGRTVVDLALIHQELDEKKEQALGLFEEDERAFNNYVQSLNDFVAQLSRKKRQLAKIVEQVNKLEKKLSAEVKAQHQEMKSVVKQSQALINKCNDLMNEYVRQSELWEKSLQQAES